MYPVLTARASRQVLWFLDGLLTPRSSEELSRVLVSRITQLVPGVVASLNRVNLGTGRVAWVEEPVRYSVALLGSAAETIISRHTFEHPGVDWYLRTGNGRATAISDFLSRRALHDLGLWSEAYRQLRVEDQLTIRFPAGRARMISLTVCRDRAGFTAEEHAVLERVRPHIARALLLVDIDERRRRLGCQVGRRIKTLSPREAEILGLLVRGQSHAGIAAVLGRSQRTIEKHVEHVYRKLGVASRAEAVAQAMTCR